MVFPDMQSYNTNVLVLNGTLRCCSLNRLLGVTKLYYLRFCVQLCLVHSMQLKCVCSDNYRCALVRFLFVIILSGIKLLCN